MAEPTKSKQRMKLLDFFRRKQINSTTNQHGNSERTSVEPHAAAVEPRQPVIPESEFDCPCCQDIISEPITLSCGHNFCRLCLARTFYTGCSKNLCPVCRQPWQSIPHVNTLLRSTIQTLHPEKFAQRNLEVENDPQAQRLLRKFDRDAAKGGTNRIRSNLDVLLTGVICTLAVGAGLFLCWCLLRLVFSGGSDSKKAIPPHSTGTHAPHHWSNEDVLAWLDTLGYWTSDTIKQQFYQLHINGTSLLQMTEEDLPHFHIKLPIQQKMFWDALEQLKYREEQRIADLNMWTYMSSHPTRVVLYYFAFSDFPRLTLLYLYMFDYVGVVKPFLVATHVISGGVDVDQSYPLDKVDVTTAMGPWSYLPQSVFLPHLVLARFCWLWSAVHTYILYPLLCLCLHATYTEIKSLYTHGLELNITEHANRMKSKLGKYVLILLLYPVMPSAVYVTIFHIQIFILPWIKLFRRFGNPSSWTFYYHYDGD